MFLRAAAVVGFLVAVGQAFKPVRDATVDLVVWLYPDGLIAVLGVSVVVAVGASSRLLGRLRAMRRTLGVVFEERDQATQDLTKLREELNPDRRSQDTTRLRELQATLPRELVGWTRTNDFGGPWERARLTPFHQYADTQNEVEHRLFDEELERLRSTLHAAVQEFASRLGHYSSPVSGAPGMSEVAGLVFDTVPEGPEGERWYHDRDALNSQADVVAEAYDALLARARERLVI